MILPAEVLHSYPRQPSSHRVFEEMVVALLVAVPSEHENVLQVVLRLEKALGVTQTVADLPLK